MCTAYSSQLDTKCCRLYNNTPAPTCFNQFAHTVSRYTHLQNIECRVWTNDHNCCLITNLTSVLIYFSYFTSNINRNQHIAMTRYFLHKQCMSVLLQDRKVLKQHLLIFIFFLAKKRKFHSTFRWEQSVYLLAYCTPASSQQVDSSRSESSLLRFDDDESQIGA